jgi:5-methylcytosine-specific restriction protein A
MTAGESRPTAARRGYGSRWQRYRLAFLRRHPLCVRCQHAATVVDHVRPVSGPDDPGFWGEANHQPLCASCHGRKTQTEDRGRGRCRAA